MHLLSRYSIVCTLIISGCIFACRKTGPTNQTPLIDNGASISMTKPEDSARFTATQSIEISGKVTGSQKDYSFLNYYVLDSAGHDTLAKGNVLADGSIDAVLPENPSPGQYHIYLKAVNKSPDTKTLSSTSRLIFIGVPDSSNRFFLLRGRALPFFDQLRNRIYYYSPDSSNLLQTINPDLLTLENATDVGSNKVLLGMDETGNSLNLVAQQIGLTDSGQLFKFDLNTHTLVAQSKFHFPLAYTVIAVSNNFVFYIQAHAIWYQDLTNWSSINTLIQKSIVGPVQTFNNNTDLLVHFAHFPTDLLDSFYVFHVNSANIQQTYTGASSQGLALEHIVVPFTAGLVGDGTNLYDQAFHLLGSLTGTDYITGISQDEKYVAAGSNLIYRISDWSVAQTLSTGLYMPYVFFKTDGSKLYPVTAPSYPANAYKLYSYPWGK
jgi:hypothetical protein